MQCHLHLTAPEVFMAGLDQGDGYSHSADWWSLGVTLYETIRCKVFHKFLVFDVLLKNKFIKRVLLKIYEVLYVIRLLISVKFLFELHPVAPW